MERETARKPRYPGFWRKKVALLRDLRELHVAASLQQLFEALTRLLRREFRASQVLFALWDARREDFFYQNPESVRGRRISEGDGLAAQAIEEQRSLLVNQPSDPQLQPEETVFGAIRTAVAVPLVRKDRILGVVELVNRSDETRFASADQEYLEELSHHMALSLNHLLLADEAERKKKEERQLREIARSLNSAFDLDGILEEILLRVREVIEFDAAAMILLPGPNESVERTIAVYGYNLQDQFALQEKARGIYREWLATTPEARLLSRGQYDDIYRSIRPTTQSEMLIPLRSREQLLGLFTLVSDQEHAYSKPDLQLLESFGHQVSLAIERARSHASLIEKTQLEQELKIARDIQLRFLPGRMPPIANLAMAARNVPSRLVSGDVYDLIPIVPGQWGIMIGDVTGKGISAGLIMAAFRAALLAEIRNNFSISTILRKVNRLLWETTDPSHFVTAFYGVYDEDRRVLTYSNAGHNPPLLLRADGRAEWLTEGGLVLGGFPHSDYREKWLGLEPGDWLILYTDGLTEARLPNGDELGQERLEELVRSNRTQAPEQLASLLAEEVLRHSPGARPEDDATLLVIHLEDGESDGKTSS